MANKISFQNKNYSSVANLLSSVLHENKEDNNLITHKLNLDNTSMEEQNAKRLEYYFNNIKQAATNIQGPFDQFILDIAKELNIGTIFQYSGQNNKKSGTQFEEELKLIIDKAFELGGIDIGTEGAAIPLGSEGASPEQFFTEEQILQHFMGNEELKEKYINTNFERIVDQEGRQMFKLKRKEGKIDISVKNFILEYTIEPSGGLKEFIDLLNGANFSAKNYRVIDNNRVSIRLGATTNIRIYESVLSYLNPGGWEEDEIFNLYMKIRNGRGPEAQKHKKHLQFIYELTGPGLQYADDIKLKAPNDIVKYLIVNSRDGQGIRVFSTRALIKQYLSNNGNQSSRSLSISFS